MTDIAERLRHRQQNRALGLGAVATTVVLVAVIAAANAGGGTPDNTVAGQYYEPPYTSVPYYSAPPQSTTGDPNVDLRQLATTDLTALSGYDGAWLPQLSSKRVGMVVAGTHYDNAAILTEHTALRTSYENVRLVWSGDWVTFSAPDFWVTMVAERFDTPEGANAWCDQQGIPATDCFAKRLGTTGAGPGNTVPR